MMSIMSSSQVSDTSVIGLHGQTLGHADHLKIDLNTGNITHLVLTTDWQKITIPWDEVQFDSDEHAFKLLPRRK